MEAIDNRELYPCCLIGNFGGEAEQNDLLMTLLQNKITSFIKIQYVSMNNHSLPSILRPFVGTWSFNDESSDLHIGKELLEVYPMIYHELLDKEKFSDFFNIAVKCERSFRKNLSGFREKNELVDICTAVILDTPMLVYVNMSDSIKLFSQENQLRLRRYGMSILSSPYKEKLKTLMNRYYSVTDYQLVSDIPLYSELTKWLKSKMKNKLHIVFIEGEKTGIYEKQDACF